MGTGQPCSHFAIQYDDGIVMQSNLLGTGIEYESDFFKHARIVHEIDIPLDPLVERQVRMDALAKFSGQKYDWGAFVYDIVRMFMHRVVGTPMDPKNLWGAGDRILCVGLAKCLDQDGMPEWVRGAVRVVPDFDVYFPEDLFSYLDSARANVESNINPNGHL
jgi:hypothetical protein